MASDQKQVQSANDKPKAKKKGLFGFLRFWRKKSDAQGLAEEALEPTADEKSAGNESRDKKASPKTGNSKTSRSSKSAEKTSARATSKGTKSRKPASDANKKAPAKKRGRPAKKDKVDDVQEDHVPESEVQSAASISLDSDDKSDKSKKRGLFSFLKRSKNANELNENAPQVEADGPVAASEDDAQDLDDSLVPKKKGFFGIFARRKAQKEVEAAAAAVSKSKKEDDNADVLLAAITGIGVDGSVTAAAHDEEEKLDENPKKGFLSKKLVIILFALFGVTGASGAAALVFAGPMFGDSGIQGLACSVAHRTDFELMQEKRVTVFLRASVMPPRERILMLIQYTKFLREEYQDADLITVSVLDDNGPTHRSNFRGQYVGAQVVHAPNPLMTMATKEPWEIRYVNTDEVFAGRYVGDRFKLSADEIAALKEDILGPSDCIAEIEAKIAAAEEAEEAEENLDADVSEDDENATLTEGGSDEGDESSDAGEDGEAIAEDEPKEPGFVDNMLAMVGLGGSDEADDDEISDEQLLQPYPPDMALDDGEMEAVPDEGFFGGLLKMVGLGGADAEEEKPIVIPGVLGRRVVYE